MVALIHVDGLRVAAMLFFHVEWMDMDARTINVHGVHEWIATLVLENGSSIEWQRIGLASRRVDLVLRRRNYSVTLECRDLIHCSKSK